MSVGPREDLAHAKAGCHRTCNQHGSHIAIYDMSADAKTPFLGTHTRWRRHKAPRLEINRDVFKVSDDRGG